MLLEQCSSIDDSSIKNSLDIGEGLGILAIKEGNIRMKVKQVTDSEKESNKAKSETNEKENIETTTLVYIYDFLNLQIFILFKLEGFLQTLVEKKLRKTNGKNRATSKKRS